MVIRAFSLASTFVTWDKNAARTPQRFIPPTVMWHLKKQSEQIITMTERDNDILEIKRIITEKDQDAVSDKAFQFIEK